jgi:hypothetical protein
MCNLVDMWRCAPVRLELGDNSQIIQIRKRVRFTSELTQPFVITTQ